MFRVISLAALFLLTLVGYSSGCVLVLRGRTLLPGLLDLAITAAVWIGALATRSVLGRWTAIAVWLLISVAAGLMSMATRRELWVRIPPKSSSPAAQGLVFRVWEGWKAFASMMGAFQSRMLLMWFYFVIVTPFALLSKLSGDPLRLRVHSADSWWVARAPASAELDDARKQF